MEPDRKTVIADAAIALLGSAGAKGLTHRAVDAQAGLPEGSTSFYCRTRSDLLALTLKRHAWLDMQDLALDAQQLASAALTSTQLIDLLMHRLADWLAPAKRGRLLARFELVLLASRDSELAATLAALRQSFVQATQLALERTGTARAAELAPRLVAAIDGILLDQIHAQEAPLLNLGQQRQLLEALLSG
jgi:DNA-binding transcriptional regulator YbjK